VKSKESKVKIIPPHRWPSLFLTIGGYDVLHDLIFIKGGLSEITFRQTLKHEEAHRKWYLHHPRIRKFYNFLYWKPALYFILSAIFVILYFCSVIFWGIDTVFLSFFLCFFTLMVFNYGLHEILERPARKVAGFPTKELGVKEILRVVIVEIIPALLLLPAAFVSLVLSPRSTLIVLGLGVFGIWLHQVLKIPIINNLRKKASS